MGHVTVLGSYNLDLSARVPRCPGPGETLHALGFDRFHGGKGSNQAIAAARAGAVVHLAGCVGDDDAGTAARALWQAEGLETSGVATVAAPTGTALILVEPTGENRIVVVSGANAEVTAAQAARAGRGVVSGDVALTQLETTLAAAETFLATSRARGVLTILNAAPATASLPPALLAATDILVVNAVEAELLAGGEALEALAARVGLGVVVTRGGAGAVWHGRDGRRVLVPAPTVAVLDSTGAGDAFVGALAARLSDDWPIEEVLAEGVAAGSMACMTAGAVPSLPTAADIVAMRARMAAAART
jgi:ribokinase